MEKKSVSDAGLAAFAKWIWKFPYVPLAILPIVVITMGAIAFSFPFQLDATGETFQVRGDEVSESTHAYLLTREEVQFVSQVTGGVEPQQTQLGLILTLLYKDERDSGNVLVPGALMAMHALEEAVISYPEWSVYCLRVPGTQDCYPPRSVSNFFFPSIVGNQTVFDGRGDFVQNFPGHLRYLAANTTALNYFVDKAYTPEDPKSQVSRTNFFCGLPLEGYENADDRYDEQVKKSVDWMVKVRKDILLEARDNSEEYSLFWIGVDGITDIEVNNLIFSDAAFALGSFFFVFFFVWGHTHSFFLASLGILGILFAFPAAYFLYRIVFNFQWMNTLNFLSLFLILGIGADDIFIFVDTWKQSAIETGLDQSMLSRFQWTYAVGAKAMFVTSFTTAAAFYANAISNIPPIRQFGIFTGTLISLNYIFVMTWFASIVVLWGRYFEGKFCGTQKALVAKLVAKFKQNAKEESVELESVEETEEDIKTRKLRSVERFFLLTYSPFVRKFRWVILAVFGALLVVATIFAVQISAASDAVKFLPDNNWNQKGVQIAINGFQQGITTVQVHLVWGVENVDYSNTNPNNPDEIGELGWNENFDISSPETQEWILSICQLVREQPSVPNDEVHCVMEDLKQFSEELGGVFPIPQQQFLQTLNSFTMAVYAGLVPGITLNNQYDQTIGYDQKTGQLRTIAIVANITLNENAPESQARPVYNEWAAFLKTVNSDAPPSIGKAIQATEVKWITMQTEAALVSTAFFGIAFSLALCFLVLLASTMNILLSIYSILSIIGIVDCIMGWMVIIGWKLGIIESVCLTILVGLSIDYVVHLANAYNSSVHDERYDRAKDALSHMGISVVSASLTTLGAALMLLFCTVLFFVKFGLFIAVNIFISALFAFMFFIALVMIIGPQRHQGDLVHYFHLFHNKFFRKTTITDLP